MPSEDSFAAAQAELINSKAKEIIIEIIRFIIMLQFLLFVMRLRFRLCVFALWISQTATQTPQPVG